MQADELANDDLIRHSHRSVKKVAAMRVVGARARDEVILFVS